MSVTHSKVGLTYYGNGIIIHVLNEVIQTWNKYVQNDRTSFEACGFLIGSVDVDKTRFWIEIATEPSKNDIRTRNSFKITDNSHKATLEKFYKDSNRQLVFFGTWHTHPEKFPSPSSLDVQSWKSCLLNNKHFKNYFFAIVGTKESNLFKEKGGAFIKLKEGLSENIKSSYYLD